MNDNSCTSSVETLSTDKTLLRISDITLCVPDGDEERTLSKHLSFSLRTNQFALLQGPSGTGKSTFLRAIIRLHPCKTGEILFRGTSVASICPTQLRSDIVYLNQKPSFPQGSVLSALMEPFGFKQKRRTAPELLEIHRELELVDLKPAILQANVAQLSGGEAQRIAFIRTILANPDIVLLDEPIANLDEESAQLLIKRLATWVSKDKHAAIVVSHTSEAFNEISCEQFVFTGSGITPLEGKATWIAPTTH